jgi:hypothetical protein
MNTAARLTALSVLSFLLLGCAFGGQPHPTGPTKAEIDSADYGTPMSEMEARRLVQAWFATRLNDSVSARYLWGTFERGWAEADTDGLYRYPRVFGYAIDVQVNSKNVYGGYVGFRDYKFIFNNGRLVAIFAPVRRGGYILTRRIL